MAKERIGLMGGSFNPIHQRHLDIAQCALTEGRLSCILFIPTGNPPHKHEGLVPAEDRFEMTRLAVMGNHRFTASRIELDRACVIYSVDTLRAIHEQRPTAELYYIIGEDTLLDLPNWRAPDEVFQLCRFLVCRRSTQDASAHPIRKSLEARGAKLSFLSLPPLDISSTHLREALDQGEAPPEIVPQVMEYIRIMGLYGITASPPEGADIYPRLKQALSDKRLLHSLLVSFAARQLARQHGLSEDKAALAALLHDCAKCLTLPQLQQIAKEHRLLLDKETLQSENLLHGPVGAAIAEDTYGITDPNVLSAIRCHTTGKVGMLPLDMVIYLADKIEPSRRAYPALETVRQLAEKSLVEAMRYSLHSTLTYIQSHHNTPHPSTQQTAEWLERLPQPNIQRSEVNE